MLNYLNFNIELEKDEKIETNKEAELNVNNKKPGVEEKKVTKLAKNELLSQVINEIGTTPTSINDIALDLKLNISEVLVAITLLELDAKIRRETGGRVSRIC